ncbi:MAG: NAD(+)/NADH kinase [Bacteroidales bacterium]|nr:NAD(+)/NADH kinase [Bacteroidales bacterium]
MKLAYYLKDSRLQLDPRVLALLADLGATGIDVYPALSAEDITPGTQMLLSFGGDGTYLSAAGLAIKASVPVLGVNFGRLGFLSENKPEQIADALVNKSYTIQRSGLVKVGGWCTAESEMFALNEVCVLREGGSMLGVDVQVDNRPLPTYWADGLIVATASGSTAYALSVGGPICLPDSRVLILAPVAPHNLNVRPLIVPDSSHISVSFRSREQTVRLSADNRAIDIPATSRLEICAVPGALGRVVLNGSNFIEALRSRLHWGSDVRNTEQ